MKIGNNVRINPNICLDNIERSLDYHIALQAQKEGLVGEVFNYFHPMNLAVLYPWDVEFEIDGKNYAFEFGEHELVIVEGE